MLLARRPPLRGRLQPPPPCVSSPPSVPSRPPTAARAASSGPPDPGPRISRWRRLGFTRHRPPSPPAFTLSAAPLPPPRTADLAASLAAAPLLAAPTSPSMSITEITKKDADPPAYVFARPRTVSKLELIEEFSLPYRDLRKLDSSFKFQHPAVMVRPESNAILVNLEDIRCIITADRAILCESDAGPNPLTGAGPMPGAAPLPGAGTLPGAAAPGGPASPPSLAPLLDMRAATGESPPRTGPPAAQGAPAAGQEPPSGEEQARLLTSRRVVMRKLKAALQTSGKTSTLAYAVPAEAAEAAPPAADDGTTPTSFSASAPPARPSQNLPFEFLVLETILQSVIQSYAARFAHVQPLLLHTLRQVQLQHITHSTLENLLRQDRLLTELASDVDSFRNAVLEVLSNDQDMSEMYLTDFARSGGVKRMREQHEEAELLFETYLKQSSELLSLIYALQSRKHSTEQLAALFLDHQRNALLKFDVGVNVGMLSMAVAVAGTSVFGMNLNSGLETAPLALYGVTAVCAALGIVTYARLRRRMWSIISVSGK